MLDIILSLVILAVLEIILGIDNLVFIAATSSRLPVSQQKRARRWGLTLAWMTRLLLLAGAAWIIRLQQPLLLLFGHGFSARDLLMALGGAFLLYKGTHEIHREIDVTGTRQVRTFLTGFKTTIVQIAALDMVVSLDSVMTAIGITSQFWIMATAITIAIIVMVMASEPLSDFIQRHPSFRMLAFSFLLLIGMILVADGFGFTVPRGYLYFAVSFSLLVEALNTWARKKRQWRAK